MFNIYRGHCGWPAVDYGKTLKNDPGQRRAGATTIEKYPAFISNKMLIRRTLHEMSVYTHRVDNMAEGSAGMTWVVCACKQNDLPETVCYTPNM